MFVLSFGAVAHVGGFNRVARLLTKKPSRSFSVMLCSYYDGYPGLDLQEVSSETDKLAHGSLIFWDSHGQLTKSTPSARIPELWDDGPVTVGGLAVSTAPIHRQICTHMSDFDMYVCIYCILYVYIQTIPVSDNPKP